MVRGRNEYGEMNGNNILEVCMLCWLWSNNVSIGGSEVCDFLVELEWKWFN